MLDATCGGRMLWVDKNHPNAVYVDRRIVPKGTTVANVGNNWEVKPDVCASFTALPFKDESFDIVLFDPPHIFGNKITETSITQTRYSILPSVGWERVLRAGFSECWRVARVALHFKWSCPHGGRALKKIELLFPAKPLYRADGAWTVFLKP